LFQRTQFKVILSFVGVSVFVGVLSLVVGWQLINNTVMSEAETRISQDLNAAWEIYNNRRDSISLTLGITTLDEFFLSALEQRDTEVLQRRLEDIAGQARLDFAGIVAPMAAPGPAGADALAEAPGDSELRTICRMGGAGDPPPVTHPEVINPAAGYALLRREPISGTVILRESYLRAEDPELVERARIEIVPTPRSAPREEEVETAGMSLAAAMPVFDGGVLQGVIYGGVLLNRSTEIVDRVRGTVFLDETYEGQSIGTATIFFEDLRISTNVRDSSGDRAIGTRVSREVKETVLDEGLRWTNPAFVVNDWYITAYDPIRDIYGERVGILYVGVLEEKYTDIRSQTLSVFIFITLAGIVMAIIFGYLLGRRLFHPVNQLIQVSKKVSQGDLSPEFAPVPKGEIGVLQTTFMEMLSSLKERDRQLKAASEIKLQQSEKQASIGRLAAGVAHEINNPLTGVLTFTHMLLRRKDLDEEVRSDLNTIAGATERVRGIVKGLLDFSRQTDIEAVETEINELIRSTIPLVENQALVKGIKFCFDPGEGIPKRTLDRNQIQSVLMNIIINAIDATDAGGHIIITTSLSISTGKDYQRGVEVAITDTGHGIPPDNLDKLFDPFFTTKDVGKGTGLGLSVSYGIIERHGGTIRVKSKIGQGSTFIIWLPIEAKN